MHFVVNNLDQMVFSQYIEKYLTFGEVENLDEDVVAVVAAAVAVAVWRLLVPVEQLKRKLILFQALFLPAF